MAVVVAIARQAALALEVPAPLRLVALVAVGAAVYLPLCAWRSPEARADIAGLIRRRRSTAGSVAEPQLP